MQCTGFQNDLQSVADDDPAWFELAAGFFTLRSALDILDNQLGTEQMVDYARRVTARIPRTPVRSRLLSILDSLGRGREELRGRSRIGLAREMLAFGEDLHNAGKLDSANDVYTFVAVQYRGDYETCIEALHKQAYANRMMRRWFGAQVAYSTMHDAAVRHADLRMELLAQLGGAYIEAEKGDDLNAGLAIITPVLRKARAAKVSEVIAKALIARAGIRGMQLDPVAAIVDGHEALDYLTNALDRERNLLNIGISFREVGHADPAVRIADHLRAKAQDVYVRLLAGFERCHLAIDCGDELTVARITADLVDTSKDPHTEFSYHEMLARANAAADRFGAARNHALDALIVARRHGMNELARREEKALSDITNGVVPVVYQYRPTRTTKAAERKLAAIERSIRQLCAA